MKKQIIALLLAVLLTGCGEKDEERVTITVPENVSEVIIAPYGSEELAFSYTAPEKVQLFVEYLQSLQLTVTEEDPGEYMGANRIITLISEDGKTAVYNHYGNLFFREMDGIWADMEYEQAAMLDEIIVENYPDIPPEEDYFEFKGDQEN